MQVRWQRSGICGHRYHLKPLICVLPSLVAGGSVDSTGFVVFFSDSLDLCNGFFEFIMHGPVQDGVTKVIP